MCTRVIHWQEESGNVVIIIGGGGSTEEEDADGNGEEGEAAAAARRCPGDGPALLFLFSGHLFVKIYKIKKETFYA